MTNLERIHRASADEIAAMLFHKHRCNYCAYNNVGGWFNTVTPCPYAKAHGNNAVYCKTGIKEWLETEVQK